MAWTSALSAGTVALRCWKLSAAEQGLVELVDVLLQCGKLALKAGNSGIHLLAQVGGIDGCRGTAVELDLQRCDLRRLLCASCVLLLFCLLVGREVLGACLRRGGGGAVDHLQVEHLECEGTAGQGVAAGAAGNLVLQGAGSGQEAVGAQPLVVVHAQFGAQAVVLLGEGVDLGSVVGVEVGSDTCALSLLLLDEGEGLVVRLGSNVRLHDAAVGTDQAVHVGI